MIQIEVVKNNGDLGFQFVEAEMQKRVIVIENISRHQVAIGEKWWADITCGSDQKKGPVTVSLIRKIDLPKLELVDSLPDFWIQPRILRHIQILLLNGQGVYLIGHKGTGKTEFAFQLAQAWGCQLCKVDCGTLQTVNSLFGSEAAEKAETVWRPSDFWHFCQEASQSPEQRFLLVMDELSRMHPKMGEGLHPLFDHKRQISFTTTQGTKVLHMPMNVMPLATANEGPEYTATYKPDQALKDRFVPIWFSYPPAEFEEKMLVERHGIHPRQAGQIVKIARQLRKGQVVACYRSHHRRVCPMRQLLLSNMVRL